MRVVATVGIILAMGGTYSCQQGRSEKGEEVVAAAPTAKEPAAKEPAAKPSATASPKEPLNKPNNPTVKLNKVSTLKETGTRWNAPGNIIFDAWIKVELPRVYKEKKIEIAVDNNDAYLVTFLLNEKKVGSFLVDRLPKGHGLRMANVPVSKEASGTGFDAVKIAAVEGDGAYSLGHLAISK